MKIKFIIYLIILLTFTSCTVTWQKAMRYGEVERSNLCDTVFTERFLGLMIVPVSIEGETYRFLFDTGAPFAISEELQQNLNYKTVTNGHIEDSDKNHTKIAYVAVDSLTIGQTTFGNMTAFVGNFRSNPKLACLELDGIIGSNLIRHCNWQVDLRDHLLVLNPELSDTSDLTYYPFASNHQFDIIVDLNVGDKILNRIKLDYGFNGFLSLRKTLFNHLIEEGVIDNYLVNRGESQSGIIGEAVKVEERLCLMDSVWLGDALFQNLSFEESPTSLFGTAALDDYVVSIDWERHLLLFEHPDSSVVLPQSYGFTLGIKDDGAVYVQSVIDSSSAFVQGLHFGDEVLGVNSVDFSQDAYCGYVQLVNERPDSLVLKVLKNDTLEVRIDREPLFLFE